MISKEILNKKKNWDNKPNLSDDTVGTNTLWSSKKITSEKEKILNGKIGNMVNDVNNIKKYTDSFRTMLESGEKFNQKIRQIPNINTVTEIVFDKVLSMPSGVDLSRNHDGSIIAHIENNILHISSTNEMLANYDCSKMFCEEVENKIFTSLVKITLSNFDSTNTINMEKMFYECNNLVMIDFNNLNMSNTTNVSEMFCGCAKLKGTIEIPHGNFIYFNMFNRCSTDSSAELTIKYVDLISRDIAKKMIETKSADSKVIFFVANLLSGVDFNVKIKTLANINTTTKLEFKSIHKKNMPTSDFVDLSLSQDGSILGYCDTLKTIVASPYDIKFNAMSNSMFSDLVTIESIVMDNVDMSEVTTYKEFCKGMIKLTDIKFAEKLNLKKLDPDTGIDNIFEGCKALWDISPLSKWRLENSPLTSLRAILKDTGVGYLYPISLWNTSKIKIFDSMFSNCENLRRIDILKHWDTRELESCHSLFRNTKIWDATVVDDWRITQGKVKYAAMCMFYDCVNLTDIPTFKNWDMREQIPYYYFSYAFKNCPNINGRFTVTVKSTKYENVLGDMFDKNLKNYVYIDYLQGCLTGAEELVRANNNPKVVLGREVTPN